jgi:hypothetical protein
MKSDGSVRFLFKKEYLRKTGEIINDSQKIFEPPYDSFGNGLQTSV